MARLRAKRKQTKSKTTLKPQKTRKLKNRKRVQLKDQCPPSPASPSPQRTHLATKTGRNLEQPQNPSLDITLSSQNFDKFDSKNLSIAMKSMPPSPETPSHLTMVPCKNLAYTHSSKKKKKKKSLMMICHWNKKKLETLTNHFNPIPFSPKKRPLKFAKHETLLRGLGLWDFLHLDFDQKIRTDLIKELVVFYNPRRHIHGKSYVNGLAITLSRGALGNALHLPVKSRNLDARDGGKEGRLMVSEEEALFLEELVWDWLVLQDDGCKVIDEVLKFTRCVRERTLEEVDWAGLIWFMVERELLKGQNLVNCYYASHLQILLKHQRPKLFESDDVENDLGDEANLVDVKMLQVANLDKVDNKNVLFGEELKKEGCVSVEKDAEITGIGQDDDNIVVKCYKRRSAYLEKCSKERKLCMVDHVGDSITIRDFEGEELEKQQNGVDRSDGKLGYEEQIKGITEDHHEPELQNKSENEKKGSNVDELKCDEMDYQQGDLSSTPMNVRKDLESSSFIGMLINQETRDDGLKMDVSTDLISSGMDDLNRQEIDNQRISLAASQENGERKPSLEVCEEGDKNAVDMLMNQDTHEEGLKIEQSTDFTLGGMDNLNEQRIDNQQIDLVSNQESSENELSIEDSLRVEQHVIVEVNNQQIDLVSNQEKVEKEFNVEGSLEMEQRVAAESTLDEQRATQMEPRSGWMVVHGEKEIEVMDGLAKEVCESEIGELLHDNRDNAMRNIQIHISAENHNIFSENALKEGANQRGMHLYNFLKSSEENVAPEARDLNEFLGADMVNKQVILNAEPCRHGSDHVMETKGEDITHLEHEEKDNGKWQLNKIDLAEGFVLQHCAPRNVEVPEVHKERTEIAETIIFHDAPKECTSFEDLCLAQEAQSTAKTDMHFGAPQHIVQHSFIEPFVPKLDVQVGTLIPSVHAEAHEMKNLHTSATFLEHSESHPDVCMNLASSSFDNSLRREIGTLNYGQNEHSTDTTKRIQNNDADDNESLDLDLCTKQLEVWMARLKSAAKKRTRLDDEINGMLLKKLEEQNKIIAEQNKIIQQHENLKHEEEQKKQKDIYRYERELHLMQGVLCDYRKALKEVSKSFAKYRERCQLPEEPHYMDDPCGGGRVILATELNKLEQERQNKATRISIEALMKNFQQEWVGKLEGYFLELDHVCDRLEEIEIAVSMLKGKFLKPQSFGT